MKEILKDLSQVPNNWKTSTYESANDAWEHLYVGLCTQGIESAPRGKRIKETLECSITINNPEDCLVYSKYRGLSPVYAAKEYLWYKEGSRDPEDAPRSEFWKSIANEDDGLINSNYGAYIFPPEADGKSVWDKTVELFQKDPDTRHGIIQIPIMPHRGSKDTPCTSSIHFILRNGYLYSTVYMRSCDIIAGFPYDIFQFCMWHVEMALDLGVEVGTLRYIAGSLHVYEEDWIENRESFYSTTIRYEGDEDNNLYSVGSVSFLTDIINLRDNGKKAEVTDPQLRYMLKNMKIWKRKAW